MMNLKPSNWVYNWFLYNLVPVLIHFPFPFATCPFLHFPKGAELLSALGPFPVLFPLLGVCPFAWLYSWPIIQVSPNITFSEKFSLNPDLNKSVSQCNLSFYLSFTMSITILLIYLFLWLFVQYMSPHASFQLRKGGHSLIHCFSPVSSTETGTL